MLVILLPFIKTSVYTPFLLLCFSISACLLVMVPDDINFLEPLPHFRIYKLNGVDTYLQGSFNSSAATHLHAAPVFKTLGNEIIGRYRRNRFVQLLTFTVFRLMAVTSPSALYFGISTQSPMRTISLADICKLGHQSQNGILKDEQYHCCYGAKCAQEIQR
jgi:hypothetical protein